MASLETKGRFFGLKGAVPHKLNLIYYTELNSGVDHLQCVLGKLFGGFSDILGDLAIV